MSVVSSGLDHNVISLSYEDASYALEIERFFLNLPCFSYRDVTPTKRIIFLESARLLDIVPCFGESFVKTKLPISTAITSKRRKMIT